MNAPNGPAEWLADNQGDLMAGVARIRAALEAHAARVDSGPATVLRVPTMPAGTRGSGGEPAPGFALASLCAAFGLTGFERDLLLLCAGMELDGGFPALCAAAHGDARRPYPSFSLALAVLDAPHWSALPPAAALRHWRLIEPLPGDTLTLSPLRIDEHVLHYLTGMPGFDARLESLIEPLQSETALPDSHEVLRQRIVEVWTTGPGSPGWPVVQLVGPEDAGPAAIAAAACADLGLRAYVLRDTDIPANTAEQISLARLWQRDAVLNGAALVVDHGGREGQGLAGRVLSFVETITAPVLVTGPEPLRGRRRAVLRLEVAKPSAAEQRQLWESGLGAGAGRINGQIHDLVTQFNLGAPAIRDACSNVTAARDPADHDPKVMAQELWRACRIQARPRLDDLAQRIEPAASWDDLVLPEAQRQILRDLAAHVRQRIKVYETWGMAARSSQGLGISALFSGVSGTGKTMAAEVLAGELDLDLYRIDLSGVVSKYIGETEKNLRRVFDAAEAGGAILLFDEADALFGRRSEVKDSHDRYANIEVSYLLQRMEAYRGLAILTTNLKNAIDTAFLRRIRFVVQFPFPEAAQRLDIWRRIYPRQTPTQDLDLDKLARLNITGGNIRNIAMNAAFLAADADEPVRMAHLLRAARSEYAKLEKPLTDGQTAGWI